MYDVLSFMSLDCGNCVLSHHRGQVSPADQVSDSHKGESLLELVISRDPSLTTMSSHNSHDTDHAPILVITSGVCLSELIGVLNVDAGSR